MRRLSLALKIFIITILSLLVRSQEIKAIGEQAIFEEVKGSVEVIDRAGKVRQAKEGSFVLEGEIVETRDSSFARLLFGDGSTVELKENSRIKVNNPQINKSGFVSILIFIGRLFADIRSIQDGETAFEIETPTCVCGIRGTKLDLGVAQDGSSIVGVEEGRVEVSDGEGVIYVSQGQEVEFNPAGRFQLAKFRKRTDEEWRRWFEFREEQFIKHADEIVSQLVEGADRTRKRVLEKEADLKQVKARVKELYRSKPKKAKELYPYIKNTIAKEIKEYLELCRQLEKADNRMMATYYIIARAYEQTKAHPERYKEEFVKKISDTKKALDDLDIRELHNENQRVIKSHIEEIRKMVTRYQNVIGKDFQNISKEQKERLKELYRERREQFQKRRERK